MMKVAAIDVGTNSTRLLIAEVSRDFKLRVIHSDLVTTRLGEGISAGCLMETAMVRTVAAIKTFFQYAQKMQVERVIIAATSAVRDAVNRDVFSDMVYQKTGIKPLVLSGEQEAAIGYRGVQGGMVGAADGLVVLDVGGGSTEICWQQNETVYFASVNVGAVRMTEGGHSDEEITGLLRPLLKQIDLKQVDNLVAVGGTATTLAAIIQQLAVYDPRKVHGFIITQQQIERVLQRLSSLSIDERKNIPGLQPQRADIIVAGVRIIKQMLDLLQVNKFIVSEADILWGLVINAAANVDKKPNTTY
ncbi:Ppx/GppA phosphatase family protein [Peptococcaceae bacterium 1198_IL3148]